ncbi:hypothetical protein OAH06_02630 [Akkermansiaceae bacterium]|nr:hypothetical protein [Akkermansiaceae bacterium]
MNIIISIDYELYGNGGGCVFKHMIQPTAKLLEICNQKGIKITIFFEAIEYMMLRREWARGNKMGYDKNPVEAIDDQIKSAVMAGHDIQLHVHPQWVNAKFENAQWVVDSANWRLGDLNLDNWSIKDLLREGKTVVEQLVRQVEPGYRCLALRAGGYNILPSGEIYQAMVSLGLECDSSIYPGGFENGFLNCYDYRNSSIELDNWMVMPEDFSILGTDSKVMEIPLFALPRKRIYKFSLPRVKSALANRVSAFGLLADKTQKKSLLRKLLWLFEKEALTWDFCLFGKQNHKYFFRFIEKHLSHKRKYYVLIGHSKGLTDIATVGRFFNMALERNVGFCTLKDAYYLLRSRKGSTADSATQKNTPLAST